MSDDVAFDTSNQRQALFTSAPRGQGAHFRKKLLFEIFREAVLQTIPIPLIQV